jgi:hypothetical protein
VLGALVNRLVDGSVAFPSLVFKPDVLDHYGVRIRIEIGQSLNLRYPAAEYFVGQHSLAPLIKLIDQNISSKISGWNV